MLFAKLAWRNTLRNKRRTVITGFAVGIGLASLIFTDALIIGMNRNLVDAATSTYLGQAQIHRAGFRQSLDVDKTLNGRARVEAELRADPLVKRFAPRVMSFGMITSASEAESVEIVGIDPSSERYISEIDENVIQGSYFGGGERDIVIGSRLAELLGAGVGDKVVLTAARAGSGELSQELFRITGIYRFGIDEMDRGMAFIRLRKAQEMLGLGDEVHELAVRFTDPSYAGDASLPFWGRYSSGGNEAAGWTALVPQLKGVLELTEFSTFIMALILFSIIALGIINTLFMSLYERMFEFGVMRAVGTRPAQVARLIFLEAGALALISIAMGALLGLASTLAVSHIGINYNGIEYAGVTFRRLIYPEVALRQYVMYPLWVFFFILLAAVYPAVHAARMSSVDAMRRSM